MCSKVTMTHHAAALETYNDELLKSFVDLHSKRDELNCHISLDEKEKERLQHDIQVLSGRLCSVTQSLAQRLASRDAFDITITEAKAAYTNIVGTSQSLLGVLKKEAGKLSYASEPRRAQQ